MTCTRYLFSTKHVFKDNQLTTNKQWVCQCGYSTELLLVHLTETWRMAVHSDNIVAVAFVDFKRAFDILQHEILLRKLEEFTVLKGVTSDLLPVTAGMPQGSVLGLTLFTLFTNDLPAAVPSGSMFMYADDTSIVCIGQTTDLAIALLNNAL